CFNLVVSDSLSVVEIITIFSFILFFFSVTPTPKIYTLSLHDALPISAVVHRCAADCAPRNRHARAPGPAMGSRPHARAPRRSWSLPAAPAGLGSGPGSGGRWAGSSQAPSEIGRAHV